jgi:hypothetical protein
MPEGPITTEQVRNAELTREDLAASAREPLEDHSHSSWGAWGEDQIAQEDEEKPLVDVLSVSGKEQRVADRGSAASVPPREVPSALLNPTARDIRMDTHDTDEVRPD